MITLLELTKSRLRIKTATEEEFSRLAGLLTPPPPTKTIHFVQVFYGSEALHSGYWVGLYKMPTWLNDWLAPQGLALGKFVVESVRLDQPPESYTMLSLVQALQARGYCKFDGSTAWYLFSQDNAMKLVLYGTLGGNVFGGPQFPGLSMFMVQGLHALAYDGTHPTAAAKGESWNRQMALGAIAHELGHNLCGLPDPSDGVHKESCVMRVWWTTNSTYETEGYLLGKVPGNERQALIDSGFMRVYP